MKRPVLPVILCGGSGTRLWPLSRKSLPKQFVPLIPSSRSGSALKSLLGLTLERVSNLSDETLIVAADEHRFLVQEEIDVANITAQCILEPMGRDTAAAIASAALNVAEDQLLLFTPADHHIPDARAFTEIALQGVETALLGHIVTFGVAPNFPSTAYGYIQQGSVLGERAFEVDRFVEKPPVEQAEAMLLAGGYFWNAGIFLATAKTILHALEQHAPDILSACQNAVAAQNRDKNFIRLDKTAFANCRSASIDYAVLERHDKVAMIPFHSQWSDVGSWNAVAQLNPADAQGNHVQGQGTTIDAQHTYIYAPHRPVVALGTQNLLIIDTQDALLVSDATHAEQVKQAVTLLERNNVVQATQHRHVARPWGSYDSIDKGQRFQVKRITVKPGGALSLQMHHHRAEHWIVVSGTAKVTRGNETFLLTEDQSTYIPLGEVHRLENPGKTPLEMIEVQSGSYLGEDDIVRFEDNYNRPCND